MTTVRLRKVRHERLQHRLLPHNPWATFPISWRVIFGVRPVYATHAVA